MRAFLMQHWDPIGIKDAAQCYDEYDSYIPQILQLINSGVDAGGLATFLDRTVSEAMGLDSNMSESTRVATLLLRR